jgi:hypothetical protein
MSESLAPARSSWLFFLIYLATDLPTTEVPLASNWNGVGTVQSTKQQRERYRPAEIL